MTGAFIHTGCHCLVFVLHVSSAPRSCETIFIVSAVERFVAHKTEPEATPVAAAAPVAATTPAAAATDEKSKHFDGVSRVSVSACQCVSACV